MTKYDVEIYREGKWWMVDIAALDLLTQARRLSDTESAAREAIAVTEGKNPASVELSVRMRPIAGIDVDGLRNEIAIAQRQAAQLEREANVKSRALTARLTKAGVPLRDIGAIIGRSHQRVHQLLD